MESTGKAGRIHVSEKTFGFLKDNYIWEAGDEVEGMIVEQFSHFECIK